MRAIRNLSIRISHVRSSIGRVLISSNHYPTNKPIVLIITHNLMPDTLGFLGSMVPEVFYVVAKFALNEQSHYYGYFQPYIMGIKKNKHVTLGRIHKELTKLISSSIDFTLSLFITLRCFRPPDATGWKPELLVVL